MQKGRYNLLYNDAYKDYHGAEIVEIGKVMDAILEKPVMYIYYERDLYRTRGYHMCIEEYQREDGDYPVAMTDDLHRPCLFEHPEIFLCLMLHELGHFVNDDLNNLNSKRTHEENVNQRLQAILAGKIQAEEREADAFAAQCVGKNTFMRAMDYMIKMRKKRGDNGAALAIREKKKKKKAVQNMRYNIENKTPDGKHVGSFALISFSFRRCRRTCRRCRTRPWRPRTAAAAPSGRRSVPWGCRP